MIPSDFLTEDRVLLRISINPLAMWLWIAGPIFVIGTIFALWPQPALERKAKFSGISDPASRGLGGTTRELRSGAARLLRLLVWSVAYTIRRILSNRGSHLQPPSIMSGREWRSTHARPEWGGKTTTRQRAGPSVSPQIEEHEDGKCATVIAVNLFEFIDCRLRLVDVLRNGIPRKALEGVIVGQVA